MNNQLIIERLQKLCDIMGEHRVYIDTKVACEKYGIYNSTGYSAIHTKLNIRKWIDEMKYHQISNTEIPKLLAICNEIYKKVIELDRDNDLDNLFYDLNN